jgi:hypothetical protein
VRAPLTDNEWVFLQTAVDMLSDRPRDVGSRIPPCLRIERAWRLGTVRLQGVRPPGVRSDIPPWGVLEEIDAREWAELSLDCKGSRAVYRTRKRVTIFEDVEARLADIERLKREGEEDAAPHRQDLTPSIAAEGSSRGGGSLEAKAREEVAALPSRQAPPSASDAANARNLSPAETRRAGGRKSARSGERAGNGFHTRRNKPKRRFCAIPRLE